MNSRTIVTTIEHDLMSAFASVLDKFSVEIVDKEKDTYKFSVGDRTFMTVINVSEMQ